MSAGKDVEVILIPRIDQPARRFDLLTPIADALWLREERFQSLFGGRVAAGRAAIHDEAGLQLLDIATGADDFCLLDPASHHLDAHAEERGCSRARVSCI